MRSNLQSCYPELLDILFDISSQRNRR